MPWLLTFGWNLHGQFGRRKSFLTKLLLGLEVRFDDGNVFSPIIRRILRVFCILAITGVKYLSRMLSGI